MSNEKFPSQDPLEAAQTIASDEYQSQQREAAEREAQTKRLEGWLDGDQANAKDLAKYLESRPYEDSEGIHDPDTDEVVEPVDDTTIGKRKRGHWGNKYFEDRRGDHYDETHENPAKWSLNELVNEYLDAEADGNKTFTEDYRESLAEKLNDEKTSISELAHAQALAEVETEISGADTPQTTGLIADAINKKVTEYHNKNIGRSSGYETHDASGKLRTVSPLEAAAERTDKFRAQIERLKDKRLAEMRVEYADLIEKRAEQERAASKKNDDSSLEPEPEPQPKPKPVEPEPIEPPTEPLDPAPQSEANVVTPGERIKLFNERLHDWSKLLSDSHFVPTTEGYDEMVTVADNIEFRHLDPEVDGVSGMGYFIKGSDVRLNATQARTLIDKVRATEWVPANLEEPVMDAVMEEGEPQEVIGITSDAEKRGYLVTIMSYSHFVDLDKDPSDLDNLEAYKDYLHGRMVLSHHIYEHYGDKLSMNYYPSAYISEAIRDFNKETDSKKLSKLALSGLKRVLGKARSLKEKRQSRKNKTQEESAENPETFEEELTEESEV